MTKKPINITIKKGTEAAKIVQAVIEQKEAFRQTVENITAARNTTSTKPQRVQPV